MASIDFLKVRSLKKSHCALLLPNCLARGLSWESTQATYWILLVSLFIRSLRNCFRPPTSRFPFSSKLVALHMQCIFKSSLKHFGIYPRWSFGVAPGKAKKLHLIPSSRSSSFVIWRRTKNIILFWLPIVGFLWSPYYGLIHCIRVRTAFQSFLMALNRFLRFLRKCFLRRRLYWSRSLSVRWPVQKKPWVSWKY